MKGGDEQKRYLSMNKNKVRKSLTITKKQGKIKAYNSPI